MSYKEFLAVEAEVKARETMLAAAGCPNPEQVEKDILYLKNQLNIIAERNRPWPYTVLGHISGMQMIQIARRWEAGETQKKLGAEFKLANTSVYHICKHALA